MRDARLIAVEKHVAAVRRKLVAQAFFRRLALSLLVLGGVAWLTTVALELSGRQLPGGPWAWLAGGLGLAALATLIWAVATRPSRHEAAVAIDERLGAHERFSTALALVGRDDPFSRLALDDASRVAAKANLRKQFPLSWPPSYAGVLVWAALIGLTVWLVEPIAMADDPDVAQQSTEERLEEQRVAAEAAINEQAAAMEMLTPEIAEREDFRLATEKLQEARRLLAEDPTKSRRTAQEAKDALAEALKNQIEKGQEYAQAREQARAFRQAEGPAPDERGPVADAHRALQEADFAEAMRQLEEAVDNFDEMTQGEKERAAEQMEQMAAALSNMADDPQAQAQMQQQLQQAGMSQQQAQQATQLMKEAAQGNQQSAQQLQQMQQQAMQQMNNGQGPSQQQAQQFNQMMQQLQQQAGAQTQASQMSQMAQQLAQAMQSQAGMQAQGQQGQQAGQQQAQQGQQGSQGSGQTGQGQQGMQQSAQQMQQSLAQMQAVQQQAQRLQQAQGMNQGRQGQQGQGQQQGGQPFAGSQGQQGQGQGQQGAGQGQGQRQGQQAGGRQGSGQWGGQGRGGNGAGGMGQGRGGQLSVAPAPFGLREEQSRSFTDDQGRIIASTLIEGDALKGESTAQLREIARSGQRDATDEVDSERIPRAARDAVREYFQTLERQAGGGDD